MSAHLYGGLNVYTGLRVGNRTLHSAVEGIQGSKRQSSQPNGEIGKVLCNDSGGQKC